MALRLRLLHRRLFRRERLFRDRTNPFDMYSDHDMFMRYRFGKGDLWQICEVLSDELSFANARLGSTSPIIQLLLTLRILACGGFLLDTGDSFGLTKATVGRLFDRVVTVLAGRLHQSARQVKRESDITLLDVLVLDLVRSQTRSRTDTPTAQHGRHRLQPQPQAQAQAQALRKPIISILCFRLFFYDYDSTIPPPPPPPPPPYPPPPRHPHPRTWPKLTLAPN